MNREDASVASEVIFGMLESLASRVKGVPVKVDRSIPVGALIDYLLSRFVFALRGAVKARRLPMFGRGFVFCGRGVRLRNRAMIRIGNGVTFGDRVSVNGLSRRLITFEGGVNIGAYTIVEATGVISEMGEGVRFGMGSSIGPFSYIGAAGFVSIGENVIMGQRVAFHAENHRFADCSLPIKHQGVTRAGIVVESDCWVGAGVIFLDGAHVERGCVVAAGAVVRGRIPAYSICAGVPARVVKSRLALRVGAEEGGAPVEGAQ